MKEADYSGIDPLRVPEARRRIQAIEKYLEIKAPTTSDTLRIASSIGLSRVQFGRLVRAWRDHRNARLLVVGKRGSASRDYGVAGRAMEIMEQAIEKACAEATLAALATEIEGRCAEEVISPPSRSTINNHLRKAKARGSALISGPPRIVVGRNWFRLPIKGASQGDMPVALVAVALPERFIVAYEIGLDSLEPPSTNELVDKVVMLRKFGAEARSILLATDDRRMAAEALKEAGLGQSISHNRSVQRELSKAFGGRLGDLEVVYQRGMARPDTKRILSRQDQPLEPLQVFNVIEDAIGSHNKGVQGGLPEYDLISLTGKSHRNSAH